MNEWWWQEDIVLYTYVGYNLHTYYCTLGTSTVQMHCASPVGSWTKLWCVPHLEKLVDAPNVRVKNQNSHCFFIAIQWWRHKLVPCWIPAFLRRCHFLTEELQKLTSLVQKLLDETFHLFDDMMFFDDMMIRKSLLWIGVCCKNKCSFCSSPFPTECHVINPSQWPSVQQTDTKGWLLHLCAHLLTSKHSFSKWVAFRTAANKHLNLSAQRVLNQLCKTWFMLDSKQTARSLMTSA